MSDDGTYDDRPAFHGSDALISTYMSSEVQTIEPSASVRDVARLIASASVGCVVVGTADDVLAVVSERDVARAVADGVDLDQVTAADVGTRELVWVDEDDTIGSVAEEMMEDYVRHVLVRGADGLVGMMSMRDVIAAYTT